MKADVDLIREVILTRIGQTPKWYLRAVEDLRSLGWNESDAKEMANMLLKPSGVDTLCVAFYLIFPGLQGDYLAQVISAFMLDLSRVGPSGARWALAKTAKAFKIQADPEWSAELMGKLVV